MRYCFKNCELNVGTHELHVSGRQVDVEPQVFRVLQVLVERAQQLVTRDDLIVAVWNGRIVSDAAISARISAARAAIGDSGAKQVIIKTVPRCGYRFVADVTADAPHQTVAPAALENPRSGQSIRLCRSGDGHKIAYATFGAGVPLLRAGHWLTHLDHDWNSPVWRPYLDELGKTFRVTRYDQRGNGLSDWDVSDFSMSAFVGDMEAVVEAAGLERFVLYGSSQGAPIAIAYAVQHPERVSHLILHGGFSVGRSLRGSSAEREAGAAIQTLIRHGWGKVGSPFIRAFSSMFIPDGTMEQMSSLTDMQKLTTSADNASRLRAAVDQFDVRDTLSRVSTPTLVIHANNDGVHPLDQGRGLAASIQNAELVVLESANHVILPQEPAWELMFREIRRFVSATRR